MGYQDREYFRNQPHPFWNLLQSTKACWGIVVFQDLAFLTIAFIQVGHQPLRNYLRLDAYAMLHDWQWYRLVTASLVVENPWHLGFSLLVIWLIGMELETLYGSLEFVSFYVVTNLLGNLAQFVVYQTLAPAHIEALAFGPSSAAMAILLLGVLHYPHRMVTYLLVPMQMWIFGLVVLIFEVFFFMQHVPVVLRVAVQLPTLLWAFTYHQLAWRIMGRWSWPSRRNLPVRRQLASISQTRPQTRRQVLDDELTEPVLQLSQPRMVDEQLEAKMDAILEKVGQSGMDSLSDEEKNILQRASEALRRKQP
jgi:membrane associated rhomboid family serine protease